MISSKFVSCSCLLQSSLKWYCFSIGDWGSITLVGEAWNLQDIRIPSSCPPQPPPWPLVNSFQIMNPSMLEPKAPFDLCQKLVCLSYCCKGTTMLGRSASYGTLQLPSLATFVQMWMLKGEYYVHTTRCS